MWSMPADRFFRLAVRLPAYQGVMQVRALEARRDEPDEQPPGRDEQAPSAASKVSLDEAMTMPGVRGNRSKPPVFNHIVRTRPKAEEVTDG